MTDETWKTKDGREILVSDMTEAHAKNCLCLLIRRIRGAQDRAAYGPVMSKESWDFGMPPQGCDDYGSLK